MKNQECKVRTEIVDVSSIDSIFYPVSIRVNKYSGNCNNVNDPYAKICTSDIIKNLNVKVFNLMTLTNKTRHLKWHDTCKCVCRLDKIIFNITQRWHKDKYRCECKKLVDKGVSNKWYLFNPSNCDCECDKSFGIGEYLDYLNCNGRKKLIDPLTKNPLKILLRQSW